MAGEEAADGGVMPVFVIKAKDALAVSAIRMYGQLCREAGLDWQADQVAYAEGEIVHWQRDHPELVKMPHHRHVPAGTDG